MDKDWQTRIIDFVRRNRVSSTEVCDCLEKSGSIPGVSAINRGHFRVGRVFWAFACHESNWSVHEQIQRAGEGDIVLVDAFDCGDRAIFGDLVSKYLMLYRQAAGIVVNGNMRDVHRLIKENWPIWCRGFNPAGCFNEAVEMAQYDARIAADRARYDGAIAVCDDTGVVVIPKEQQCAEFLDKLEHIEDQEDIWYECVDRRKWSTYETVCLKRYLNDES